SVYRSFMHSDLLSSPRWVGTANYSYLFHGDPQVGTAVKNTLWFIAIAVPLQVLFAFGIALMLARARRGVGVFRTIFYLPALAPPVAATLGFVYILNPATGPVNVLLGHLGVQGPLWFHDPHWSKPALVALGLWGVGNTMVIFLAAVLDVPTQLYESTELDGAGFLSRLRWVTLRSISPVILFAAVYGVIQGLQYFTQAYVAAGVAAGQASQAADVTSVNLGYPKDSTLFYPILLYQHGFNDFQMGYASAIATVLLVVSFAIALMLPPQVTVVPLYVMWAKVHPFGFDFIGTLWPVIIPNWFGDAFSIFLLRQFFLTIPEEYLDAARVDGCGELRILTTVVTRL